MEMCQFEFPKFKKREQNATSNIRCFQDLVYGDDIDVIYVNETWLNGNIPNLELLNDDFTIYLKDRTAKRAGGVLINRSEEWFAVA